MGREFVLQIPRLYKNLDELWVVARRTDRLKSLQEQVKIPVRIFDGDMQRNYIFKKIQVMTWRTVVITNKAKLSYTLSKYLLNMKISLHHGCEFHVGSY